MPKNRTWIPIAAIFVPVLVVCIGAWINAAAARGHLEERVHNEITRSSRVDLRMERKLDELLVEVRDLSAMFRANLSRLENNTIGLEVMVPGPEELKGVNDEEVYFGDSYDSRDLWLMPSPGLSNGPETAGGG